MTTTQHPQAKAQKIEEVIPPSVVKATVANLHADFAEPIQWLYKTAVEQGWSIKQASQHIGKHESNLPRVLRGTYKSLVGFASAINMFRDQYEELKGAVDQKFHPIPEAKTVFYTCEKIIASKEMGILHGPLGHGKTIALESFAKKPENKCRVFRCRAAASYGAFVSLVAYKLNIKKSSIANMVESIHQRLRRLNLDLLIFDEMHEIFITSNKNTGVKIFEFIREIFDVIGTPVLLCGTEVLPKEMKNGIWEETLRQVRDRGDTEVCVKKRTNCKGLAPIFSDYGLPMPTGEALKLVNDIIEAHSLRKLVIKIRASVRAATNINQAVSWDHFIDVHSLSEQDKALI